MLIVEDEPLVAKYLKTLNELEGHATRMAANRGNPRTGLTRIPGASKEDLVQIAHSIAGSAGTFGFPEVSEAKERVDEGIARLLRVAPP